MPASYLRIYRGPDETAALEKSPADEPRVTATLGEILPLLADAVNSRRTWLSDFESDEITLSTDLYEVLMAYQYYRRPSA